jgi:uncharacterized membrane protein
MTMLSIGLFIWVTVHLFPSALPNKRQSLIARLGNNAYQGIFALLILASLLLIVFGWRTSVPTHLYAPVDVLRLPAIILIFVGFILMVAAKFPATRFKQIIRHPQLTGVFIWAIAHLLMNGDSRSVLLFSVFGAWCVVSAFTFNHRDGAWVKPDTVAGWGQEIGIVIAGVVIYALMIYFHEYLSGIQLLG